MNVDLPLVSIIIPVRPGKQPSALGCIKLLDYPQDRIEVFVSEGTQPSRQRNEAVRKASGGILYFLDDDSCPVPEALKRIAGHFEDKDVAVVGGPSLTPDGDSVLQKSFGAALGSLFGGFSIRNRYRSIGEMRLSSEEELIFCNLAVRKRVFLESGGLNEKLYPNEENEMMNGIQRKGYTLIHDPAACVSRSQRPNIRAFMTQMLNYGRGRAEQTMMSPYNFKLPHLVPSMFLLYLLSTVFYANPAYLLPLASYLAICLISSVYTALERREWRFSVTLPPIYLIMHISYGAGSIWGMFRKLIDSEKKPSGEVIIRRIAAFKEMAS